MSDWDSSYGSAVAAYTEVDCELSGPLSSAPIDASGNFAISVGVPEAYSSVMPSFDVQCDASTIRTTPPDLPVGLLKLVPVGDRAMSLLQSSRRSSETTVAAFYLYARQDGTVVGQQSCSIDVFTDVYDFDLELNRGWNLELAEYSRTLESGNYINTTRATTVPLTYDLSAFSWGVTAF